MIKKKVSPVLNWRDFIINDTTVDESELVNKVQIFKDISENRFVTNLNKVELNCFSEYFPAGTKLLVAEDSIFDLVVIDLSNLIKDYYIADDIVTNLNESLGNETWYVSDPRNDFYSEGTFKKTIVL